jgi:3,4-dihydroxy-2-butanone 4-phosphate synthase
VIAELKSDTQPFAGTKSALHFTSEHPLPHSLVEELIAVRMRQAFPEDG